MNNVITKLHTFWKIPTVETQLVYWIEEMSDEVGNIDLEKNGFRVYVRKGQHCYQDEYYTFLDIARISIPDKKCGKGWFSNFLLLAMQVQPWDGIFIEVVLNERLANKLRREGWIEIKGMEGSIPSFIKFKNA